MLPLVVVVVVGSVQSACVSSWLSASVWVCDSEEEEAGGNHHCETPMFLIFLFLSVDTRSEYRLSLLVSPV